MGNINTEENKTNVQGQEINEQEKVYYYTDDYDDVHSGTIASFKTIGSLRIAMIDTEGDGQFIKCMSLDRIYIDYELALKNMKEERLKEVVKCASNITDMDKLMKFAFKHTVNKGDWDGNISKLAFLVAAEKLGYGYNVINLKEHKFN